MTTGPNIQDQQWEPVIPPGEVPFWPPQPGWYVLLGLFLLLLFYVSFILWRRRQRRMYRFDAIQAINELKEQVDVAKLQQIIKAVAIKSYGRETAAGLYGSVWHGFLDQTEPKVKLGSKLADLGVDPFAPADKISLSSSQWEDLLLVSNQWIRSHKRTHS